VTDCVTLALITEAEARVTAVPYRVEKPWATAHLGKDERYVGKILHIEAGQVLSLQYHNVRTRRSTC